MSIPLLREKERIRQVSYCLATGEWRGYLLVLLERVEHGVPDLLLFVVDQVLVLLPVLLIGQIASVVEIFEPEFRELRFTTIETKKSESI